ncbi:MAG: phosphodiesterase [Bacilli bacterium]|nr:phosphodiesterase [Bacilli bacterium]
MKILIVSDIHGNYENMKKVLENEKTFDYFFLLGDVLYGPDIEGYDPDRLAELLNEYSNKIFYVRGNCDTSRMELLDFYMEKDYLFLPIDSINFFLTHGHLYSEYQMPEVGLDYDVYIQGHTHIPVMKEKNGKIFLNPGSITLPKGFHHKSYMIYQDGEFQLKDLEKNTVIKKIHK